MLFLGLKTVLLLPLHEAMTARNCAHSPEAIKFRASGMPANMVRNMSSKRGTEGEELVSFWRRR